MEAQAKRSFFRCWRPRHSRQAKRFGVRYVCHPVGNRPPYEG
jgi:hypothetical protein